MVDKTLIRKINSTSQKNLKTKSLSKRFCTVAALVKDIKGHIPALSEDSGFSVDPWDKHRNVRPQVEAMICLSKTICHSQAYLDFLENSRDLTLEFIQTDPTLLDDIAHYPTSDIDDQKKVIGALNFYHTTASCEASDFSFEDAKIKGAVPVNC